MKISNFNRELTWEHLHQSKEYPRKMNTKEYISAEGDLRAVGDINSAASGSAARYNGAKQQLDLVPVAFWLNQWKHKATMTQEIFEVLECLDSWQKRRNDNALLEWLGLQDLTAAIPVLVFGGEKYAPFNWAKGMNYSVSTGSLLRHVKAILLGEEIDIESGETHWAHILCNVMFLSYHAHNFPELDDRPPNYLVSNKTN